MNNISILKLFSNTINFVHKQYFFTFILKHNIDLIYYTLTLSIFKYIVFLVFTKKNVLQNKVVI